MAGGSKSWVETNGEDLSDQNIKSDGELFDVMETTIIERIEGAKAEAANMPGVDFNLSFRAEGRTLVANLRKLLRGEATKNGVEPPLGNIMRMMLPQVPDGMPKKWGKMR